MKGEVGGVIADEICFPNVHKDGNLKTKKKNSYTDFKNSQFLWIKKILFFFFFFFWATPSAYGGFQARG